MLNRITQKLTVISTGFATGLLPLSVASAATVLIDEDFSSGIVGSGISTSTLDAWGSNGASSDWEIVGDQLVNSTTSTNNNNREGAAGIMLNTTGLVSSSLLELSFDYDVAAGNTLYVHLRAFNETTPTGSWWQNTGATNGNLWSSPTNGDVYNMKHGGLLTDQAAGGALQSLTGMGTYSVTIDLSSSPITDVTDFEYISLAFGSNSAVANGNISIDNISLMVPEPSGTLLLGLGSILLAARRKR